jgi:hypothetical protein
MSLRYSEFPVCIGAAGGTVPPETSQYVPTTKVDVNYTTTHSPKRKLGSTIASDEQFGFGGALTADISVDCIVQTGLTSGFAFLEDANQDDFVTIKVGDNQFNKCYATDVSVNIEPFAPVSLSARFVSLDPPTGEQITGDTNPYGGNEIPLTGDDLVYGHTVIVGDSAEILNDVQSNISFSRRYSRTPIYQLGSINADTMLLDGVEEELSVSSTGVESLIGLSGDKLTASLDVYMCGVGIGTVQAAIPDLINFPAGARVLSETYGVGGGDTVSTQATIKQVKL